MNYKNYLLTCAAVFSLVGTNQAVAQQTGARFNNLSVGAGGEMHIAYSSNVAFGQNVTTDRLAANPGIISIKAQPDSFLNSISGDIDGYMRVYEGVNRHYWLRKNEVTSIVTLSEVTTSQEQITVVYDRTNLGNTHLHDANLFSVFTTENWKIIGNNSANIQLQWSDSNLLPNPAQYGLTYQDVTIAAWNGTQWVNIPSFVTVSQNTGTVRSLSAVNFNQYSLFTFAFKNECAEIVDATGTTTWNGTGWSNGEPTQFLNAVIQAPLTVTSANSFAANSITLNSNVTIENGAYVDIVKNAEGTGIVNIASAGSFVQRSSGGTPPQIAITKQTRPLKKWDSSYWGSPVQEDIKNQIANAKAEGSQLSAYENYLKYNSDAGALGSWQPLDQTAAGRGFIARIKAQAPFVNETATSTINFPITGTANNGNIQATLGSAVTGSRSFNLLANPYPSAIDAGKLLRDNETLGGAVYLWTAKGFNSTGGNADYAIWTLAGSIATSPIAQVPTRYIASGQAFMVKGLEAGGTVNFTNCMRVTGNNNTIFSVEDHNRYWLNLTNNAGLFSQILVNYTEEATYGVDRLYDAHRNSVSAVQLYSYIDDAKFAVNSRPEFTVTDVVPLGVSKTEADANQFTIALHQPEGLFANDEATVYLYDKFLNIYHNLHEGPYTFTVDALQNNSRFEVVYQNQTFGTDDFLTQKANMNISKGQFTANASSAMNTITIYDLTGRMVQHYNVKNNEFTAPFNHASGVYIAKAQLDNGAIVTQKLINGK